MALYSQPVRALMKEMAADLARTSDVTFTRLDAINWFAQKYPKIKVGTVTANLTRLSPNARSRTHYSAKPGEDDILYQIDGNHYRLYRPGQDPALIRSDEVAGGGTNIPEGDDEQATIERSAGESEFAYEKDLRSYLAKNLRALQSGLRIYEEDGITGIEFPVGGRFIDIFAMDVDGALADRLPNPLCQLYAVSQQVMNEDGM